MKVQRSLYQAVSWVNKMIYQRQLDFRRKFQGRGQHRRGLRGSRLVIKYNVHSQGDFAAISAASGVHAPVRLSPVLERR